MWKKIAGWTLLSIVTLAGGGFAWLYFRKPASRPPVNVQVSSAADRIARGKYIFTLSDCDGCHSGHDNSKLYSPVIEAQRGAGQELQEGDLHLPVPNITSDRETGIGAWTDGEKIRAIREGIGKDGRALFPMMPYQLYRNMSDEDVESLVAYLNTLPPVTAKRAKLELPFPVNLLIKGSPRPVTTAVATPPRNNVVRYGEYLVTLGVCEGCHTPFEKGSFDTAKRLAGGRKFDFGEFSVVSANITPDAETGIGNWTLDYYLERFRRHRNVPVESLPAVSKEQWTLMPWRNLAQLSDDDLAAMFAYLKSQRPVPNKVVVHPLQVAVVK